MFTLTFSSYFGSLGGSWLHINVVINWQLSKQGIRWPVSTDRIAGSGVDPSRSSTFWSYPLTIYSFSNDCRLKFTFFKIHIKYVVFMSVSPRTITILISNWPQTQKLSQFFYTPRPIFMLWLVKIWQVNSCGKFMQHLESCLLWQLKLTEFWVNLWCF